MVARRWWGPVIMAGLVAGLLAAVPGAEAQRAADMPLDSAPQLGQRSQAGVDNLSVANDRAGSATANFGMLSIDRPTPRSTAIAERALLLARLHGAAVMQGDLGRMAEQKGQEFGVRDFGARLARDQEDADAGLLTYAARHGVNAQAMYAASEQRRLNEAELARLGRLPGAVFDRELASAVEQRQVQAIEVVQAARQSSDDPELRGLLGQMLPTLEAQYLTAQNLFGR